MGLSSWPSSFAEKRPLKPPGHRPFWSASPSAALVGAVILYINN